MSITPPSPKGSVDRPFDGVIFDMDGTLIESHIDFDAIRAALGLAPGAGILEHIASLPPDEAAARMAWLCEQEMASVRAAAILPGAQEVLAACRAAGLGTALLTRNMREAMAIALERFPADAFDIAWSREDGPIKPEPDGVLRACTRMGIAPARTACVGDFQYDIDAANAAGAVSILLARGPHPAFADRADHVIGHLDELRGILEI